MTEPNYALAAGVVAIGYGIVGEGKDIRSAGEDALLAASGCVVGRQFIVPMFSVTADAGKVDMISAVSAGVSSAAIDEYLLGWNNAGLINSTVKYTLIEAAGQLIADRLGQLPKAKDPTYAMMDNTC